MGSARTVKFCPQCSSTELHYEAGLITGYTYHCKRCDYVGPFVIERDLDEIEREAEAAEAAERAAKAEEAERQGGQAP